jgi:hypothetical protein
MQWEEEREGGERTTTKILEVPRVVSVNQRLVSPHSNFATTRMYDRGIPARTKGA